MTMQVFLRLAVPETDPPSQFTGRDYIPLVEVIRRLRSPFLYWTVLFIHKLVPFLKADDVPSSCDAVDVHKSGPTHPFRGVLIPFPGDSFPVRSAVSQDWQRDANKTAAAKAARFFMPSGWR